MSLILSSSLDIQAQSRLYVLNQSDDLLTQLQAIANQEAFDAEVLAKEFKAELKETFSFYTTQAQKVFFLGLGKNADSAQVIKALRYFFHHQKTRIAAQIDVIVSSLNLEQLEWVANGIVLGQYNSKLYKTESETVSEVFGQNGQINLVAGELFGENAKNLVDKGIATAETQMEIFDLMNAPANKKTPQVLCDWAVASAQKFGYSAHIIDRPTLEKDGFEALLAVGQGSEHDPAMIVVEYRFPLPQKTIGLVGKGVTFDTGGISIKSSTNMHLMKSDMGGAAAVLGTVELAAKLKLPVHIIGVVPTCENAVDAKSFKPSDVIGSYLGKTIEIIDTDAEGRVILADGLGYMVKNYKTDYLIDLATLTGSCISTLGYHAAGLFTNNDQLATRLSNAGERTGERLWRLPLWDLYKEDIASDIADVKNYSGKPMAGAISAAKFLEVFIENHNNWAHLDIAGTAFGDTEFVPSRAGTAYGIRLLIDFIEGVL